MEDSWGIEGGFDEIAGKMSGKVSGNLGKLVGNLEKFEETAVWLHSSPSSFHSTSAHSLRIYRSFTSLQTLPPPNQ
jgi:hypothetical protein